MSSRPAALLVAAALVLGGGTAAAADDADPEATAAIVVTPNDTVLDPDAADYGFSVLIDNTGEEPLPSGTLRLEIALKPVESESELHEEPLDDGVLPFAEQNVTATEAEDTRVADISVDREDLPLSEADPPGVYLVRATLSSGDGSANPVSSVIPIAWRGVEADAVPLATIVPIVLPSSTHAMPTRAALDELAPRAEALLDSAVVQRATLAIDPRVIAGIRAYGDDAPQRARNLLDRLEATTLPSFLLQFADADPAAQADLGFEELLQPESLSYITRLGSFPEPEAVPPDSNANDGDAGNAGTGETGAGDTGTGETGAGDTNAEDAETGDAQADDAGEDAAPALDELLAWPAQQTPTAWPAEGLADESTISLLRGAGYSTVVLDSGNAKLTGGPRAAFGSGQALITRASLGESMRLAIAAPTEVERRAGMAAAAAELAIAAQTGSTGVLLGLDRGAIGDAEDPSAAIDELASLEWVDPIPVGSLPEGTAALGEAEEPGEERLSALQAAVENEPAVDRLSVLLPDPDYLIGYQRDRLLEFFATRHASPAADFAATAEQYEERDAELEQGVAAIGTEHIQLVSASTQLPIQLHNSLPFTAIANVQVEPASAALSVAEREVAGVVVQGDGNTSITVPVHSRVSSGESALDVTVTDVTGEVTVSQNQLPITIRSQIEGIAFWILGGIAALLLVFGIIRSLRRRTHR